MAAISDKITKTMSNQNPATTTVAAQRAVGATELRGVNLDGWQDETATHFITYKVDAQGELIEGSQTDWKGIVNLQSNSIVNLKRTGGAADQGNAIGDVIEPAPTAAYGNDLAEALLEYHDTEGRLKSKTVTYDHIDEKTEYKYIASPNDLNDAQFLVPGKWRFGSSQQLSTAKNWPTANDAGVLETISYSGGATRPGTHAWSYILQIFTTLNGKLFIRNINSTDAASNIIYGAWQEFARREIKTHNKDSRGWIKRELPDGIIEYSITGSILDKGTGANDAATDIYINLPVNVPSFNAERMSTAATIRGTNAWVIASISIYNNDQSYTVSRRNAHSGVIECNFDYNIILRVYPE